MANIFNFFVRGSVPNDPAPPQVEPGGPDRARALAPPGPAPAAPALTVYRHSLDR